MIVLQAEMRNILGKKVRFLRREGKIPSELYGEGGNKHLCVLSKEARKVYEKAGNNILIELHIEGTNQRTPVLVADFSEDSITREVLSIDFRQISLTEKLTISVPVTLKGEAPAAKEGAVITHVLQDIEVECLPTNIPHEFEVSINDLLHVNDQITVANLRTPKGVEILTPPDSVIVIASEHDEESFETPPTPETVLAEEKKEEQESLGKGQEEK